MKLFLHQTLRTASQETGQARRRAGAPRIRAPPGAGWIEFDSFFVILRAETNYQLRCLWASPTVEQNLLSGFQASRDVFQPHLGPGGGLMSKQGIKHDSL